MITVHNIFYASLYDGTNGTEVADDLDAVVTFDNGTTLIVLGTEVPSDRWILWTKHAVSGDNIVVGVVADSVFPLRHQEIITPTPPELIVATGSGNIAASALGGNQNVVVNLNQAMPDTSYVPLLHLRGTPAILGGHAIANVTVTDADTVTVQITSALGALAGGSVHVTAVALATP